MLASRRASRAEKAPALKEDDLVRALVPDPSAAPEDAVVLSGFLGRSPAEGHWRIYGSPDLGGWVEVDEADILHSQPLPPDEAPLGGTVLGTAGSHPLRQSRQLP